MHLFPLYLKGSEKHVCVSEHTVGYTFTSNICDNDVAMKVLACAVETEKNYRIVIVPY